MCFAAASDAEHVKFETWNVKRENEHGVRQVMRSFALLYVSVHKLNFVPGKAIYVKSGCFWVPSRKMNWSCTELIPLVTSHTSFQFLSFCQIQNWQRTWKSLKLRIILQLSMFLCPRVLLMSSLPWVCPTNATSVASGFYGNVFLTFVLILNYKQTGFWFCCPCFSPHFLLIQHCLLSKFSHHEVLFSSKQENPTSGRVRVTQQNPI